MRPQQFYVTRDTISARLPLAGAFTNATPRRHMAVSFPPVYDGIFDRELSLIFISFAWSVLPPILATIPQAQHRIKDTSSVFLPSGPCLPQRVAVGYTDAGRNVDSVA